MMNVSQNEFNKSQISFNPNPQLIDSKEKIVPAFGGTNFHSSYTNWNFQGTRGSTSDRSHRFNNSMIQTNMTTTQSGFQTLKPMT